MLVNEQNLDLVFRGFKTVYSDAYLQAKAHKDKIAMTVASSSRDETYGWLGQFPQLREWIGPRHVHSLQAHSFTITNRKFESTVSVKRDDIADDKLGVFKPAFSEMGYLAKNHPEELVFGLLASGFTTECFDGQNFFDSDHPQTDTAGNQITVSNFQDGAEDAWFLLDTSRAVKPLIWQERDDYEFQSLTASTDSHVFMHDEYVYGVNRAGFAVG